MDMEEGQDLFTNDSLFKVTLPAIIYSLRLVLNLKHRMKCYTFHANPCTFYIHCGWLKSLPSFSTQKSTSSLLLSSDVTDSGYVYHPPTSGANSGARESRGWSRISFCVKSLFPSGCRLTASVAQPPLGYQEALLVACVIFLLVVLLKMGVVKGGAKRIVIPQSAVLYVLHSDPRISCRQQ